MVVVKTKYQAAWLGILSALASSVTFAASQSVSQNTNPFFKKTLSRISPYIVTLSAGPIWENGGQTQTFYVAPFIQKTYTANKLTNTLFDGELFLGIERPLRSNLQGQLGLAVAARLPALVARLILI